MKRIRVVRHRRRRLCLWFCQGLWAVWDLRLRCSLVAFEAAAENKAAAEKAKAARSASAPAKAGAELSFDI